VFEQTLVMLRHSERLDQMDPEGYKNSEMGQKFPFDGPLTKAGVQLAAKVAQDLKKLHDQVGFAMIACSPYLRCLETAAEVSKLLDIPIMMDQELGEVWEKAMPKSAPPHRSPAELGQVAMDLNIQVANPMMDGALKLFGKPPLRHPEDLEAGHKRYLVRIDNYIRLSAKTKQNFILVGHAAAVAATLNIFERGIAEMEKTEYCAYIIARRQVKADATESDDEPVYAAHWSIESQRCAVSSDPPMEDYMKKTVENMHMDYVQETNEAVCARKDRRTKTDRLFDSTVKAIAAGIPDENKDTENPPKEEAKPQESAGGRRV